jgi:hypothetical protein
MNMRLMVGLLVLAVAILATGIVLLATQGGGILPEEVTIQTDRDVYIPIMSSAVGIGLIPVYTLESPPETVQLHWHTDYGYFVAWDSPDFKVDLLGTEVINNGEKIYWSYDPGEMGAEKPLFEISLQIEDTQSGQVLAETSLKIGWEDQDTARVISNMKTLQKAFLLIIC